ncbi:LuxR C-terminal-related transcriptional regulator [uncultured Tenacibaculum sp.]|uniref:helix-turn-helix transcriptional regulator n=1 Tax=uncultured Tenacibaculum sp. TaxID=174713 RepID=UPI00262318E2|nr:LuxR C-terminal-related transcriptional regulator [uncultured Tenacibaculum sp.]
MKTFFFNRRNIFIIFFLTNTIVFSQKKIVEFGSEWKYYSKKEAPEKGWQVLDSITSFWKKGKGPLGYGLDSINTILNYGEDEYNKIITAYFTKTFYVENPYEFVVFLIELQKDDGIMLYLNGREIFREDMPSGKIVHKTFANSRVINNYQKFKHSIYMSPEDFKEGENILSASVHQGHEESPDLFFDLQFVGYKDASKLKVLKKEKTIKNLYLDLKLKDLGYKQELVTKISQQERLKKEGENYKLLLFIALLFFLLVIVTLYQVWKKNRLKSIKLIELQNTLKNRNQIKDSEMMNISLNSLNNKQFLKVVKNDLESNLKEDNIDALKKELNKLVYSINYNIDSREDWENFKKYFNIVHSGYLDKLNELHPSLSDAELRHCIFIKLHMQTKEIANVLHIDPRTVQSSRYRIKKKMKLAEDVNLKEYLLSIS